MPELRVDQRLRIIVGRHVNATPLRHLNVTGAKSRATVGRRLLHEFALDPNKYAEATPPLSGVTEGVRHVSVENMRPRETSSEVCSRALLAATGTGAGGQLDHSFGHGRIGAMGGHMVQD